MIERFSNLFCDDEAHVTQCMTPSLSVFLEQWTTIQKGKSCT